MTAGRRRRRSGPDRSDKCRCVIITFHNTTAGTSTITALSRVTVCKRHGDVATGELVTSSNAVRPSVRRRTEASGFAVDGLGVLCVCSRAFLGEEQTPVARKHLLDVTLVIYNFVYNFILLVHLVTTKVTHATRR